MKGNYKDSDIGIIPKDWQYKKLGDLTLVITKGTTPTTLKKKFMDSGVNFIKVESITDSGEFVDSKFGYIDEETNLILNRSILKENDILFSIAGNIGRTAIVIKRILPANTNQALAIIRPNLDLVFPIYLRYYLSNKKYLNEIRGNVVQSVQANLSLSELSNSIINLPLLPEQKAIAKVLSDLDDKIELNNEMNKTLEEIGHSLFKRWFIDFEFPDENGNPYRSSGGEMVYSEELGKEIPKSWEVKNNLSEICSRIQYGYTMSSTEDKIGPKFLRVMDINKGDWINWEKVPYCQIEYDNYLKYKLEEGDIVIARMADPGKVAIFESELDAVFASYLIRIQFSSKKYSYYLYYLMKSKYYQNYINGASTGSVQKSLNAPGLTTGLPILIPTNLILNEFNLLIKNLRTQINSNINNNENLSELRDSLLPKLMSGEIRVPLEASQ